MNKNLNYCFEKDSESESIKVLEVTPPRKIEKNLENNLLRTYQIESTLKLIQRERSRHYKLTGSGPTNRSNKTLVKPLRTNTTTDNLNSGGLIKTGSSSFRDSRMKTEGSPNNIPFSQKKSSEKFIPFLVDSEAAISARIRECTIRRRVADSSQRSYRIMNIQSTTHERNPYTSKPSLQKLFGFSRQKITK